MEQCESILANETEIMIECDSNHTVLSKDITIPSQTEKAENLLSDSILVKETQEDADPLLRNDKSSGDHDHDDSLATDGSCTVLGPTPITSVPESQFTRSASTHGASLDLHKVEEGEPKMQTQQDPRSSSGSESSGTCSPVQSGGTVCIGETQFTKSESKLSPSEEERQTAETVLPTGIMPSPLQASPTCSEIQSPIIPLQNSAHHCHDLFSHSGSSTVQVSQQQQPLSSVSKIAETQFISSNNSNRGDIVPSSQPSPSASKRQSAASLLKLPGLTTVQYRKPQPQATMMVDGRVSLEQKEKEDIRQNLESQTLAVRQSEEGGHLTKSLSKSLTVEQNQNSEHMVETTIATERSPTQQSTGGGACVNVPPSSMSLAYSSLRSQQANLQSQISSSLDLSSQQLELLRLEMEEKQREIDELEAALKLVEEKEKEIITQPGGSPVASTQSSVRSITVIAETMPGSSSTCGSTGQMMSPPNHHVSSPEHCAPAGFVENPLSGGQAKSNTADNVEAIILSSREASPECMDVYAPESIENPLSGYTKSLKCSQVAVRLPDHASVSTIPSSLVANSQFVREQSSIELSQIRVSTFTATLSSQVPSDESTTTKVEAVTTIAPNIHQMEATEGEKSAQHQNPISNMISEDLHAHAPSRSKNNSQSLDAARLSNLSKTTPSLHSEIEPDTESDTSSVGETPSCTSQSVLATLQAADDILRKLRSPPLAVLEERSSMEIDTDLYHSSGTSDASHKQSLKAKKLHVSVSTDAAKPTGASDKAQTALVVVEKDATLEVDDQLCTGSAKEEVSAKRGKGSTSTSRGKRAHSASTKSKSKKTKIAPLVVYESEDIVTVTRPPEFRSRNQVTTKSPLSNIFTSAKSSEINHPSSPALPSVIAQSPDRAHCSREGGRGSTTPTYGGGAAVCHQIPKAQHSSNSGTAIASSISEDGGGGVGKEVPAVSPCRPLSRVGKDHPPSYIGSGLSKTQLVSYHKMTDLGP